MEFPACYEVRDTVLEMVLNLSSVGRPSQASIVNRRATSTRGGRETIILLLIVRTMKK